MRHHKSSIVYQKNLQTKKYFYVSIGNIFLLFFVEALGNCPVCPPPALNPALVLAVLRNLQSERNTFITFIVLSIPFIRHNPRQFARSITRVLHFIAMLLIFQLAT